MKKYLAVLLLLIPAPSAMALFVGSDFEITLFPNGFRIFDEPDNLYSVVFGIELTNLSDEPAIFGENIFQRGTRGPYLTLNGENASDSEYYDSIFFDFSPFFPDETLMPGETGEFGGLVITFSLDIPNPSSITFDIGHLGFSNNALDDIPPDGDQRFEVFYNGPPVEVIATPIPAVGFAIFPLLMWMRFGKSLKRKLVCALT